MATRLLLQAAASKRCDLAAPMKEQPIRNAKAFATGEEDILVEDMLKTAIRIITAKVHPRYF